MDAMASPALGATDEDGETAAGGMADTTVLVDSEQGGANHGIMSRSLLLYRSELPAERSIVREIR